MKSTKIKTREEAKPTSVRVFDWKWIRVKVLLGLLFVSLCAGSGIVAFRLLSQSYGASFVDEAIMLVVLLIATFLGGRLDASTDQAREKRQVQEEINQRTKD